MLGDKFGKFFDSPLSPLARRIPLSPNTLSITGFFITVLAAIIIPFNLRLGGIIILFGGIFDMLDGLVARTSDKATEFGAFLDSVLDRYSDAFLFLAVAGYFAEKNNYAGAYISLGTLIGAFLISYARARAEGLSRSCHAGIMERPERIILLAFAAITGWIMPVLWAMLVLTHVTVFQRIYYVWRQMNR